jgi:hypothetical protein
MSLALSAGQRSHRAWAETIHAEWTKLRTLASTRWLLLGAAALTVAVSAAVVAGSGSHYGCRVQGWTVGPVPAAHAAPSAGTASRHA